VLPLFEVGKNPFDKPTLAASASVALVFLGGEPALIVGLLQNSVGHALFFKVS
jgi:hypothetical protein